MTSKLLLIFVHGFMGSKDSFLTFPDDISQQFNADYLCYEYETKGEYDVKTKNLAQFLNNISNSHIVILSHSMGGPLSIDALKLRPNPRVKGVLTFDSPFFGLDPWITKAGANRAQDAINSVSSYLPKSSSWGMLAVGVGAAAALFAAARPAVKDAISSTIKSHTDHVRDHFQFLGPLWCVPSQSTRFDFLENSPFQFHGLYIQMTDGHRFSLPPSPEIASYFSIHKMNAKDAIEAHMNMFDSSLDPTSYVELLSQTITKLSSWI